LIITALGILYDGAMSPNEAKALLEDVIFLTLFRYSLVGSSAEIAKEKYANFT